MAPSCRPRAGTEPCARCGDDRGCRPESRATTRSRDPRPAVGTVIGPRPTRRKRGIEEEADATASLLAIRCGAACLRHLQCVHAVRAEGHQYRISVFGFGLNQKGIFQNRDVGESCFLQILRELVDCESRPIRLLRFNSNRWRGIGRAGCGLAKAVPETASANVRADKSYAWWLLWVAKMVAEIRLSDEIKIVFGRYKS